MGERGDRQLVELRGPEAITTSRRGPASVAVGLVVAALLAVVLLPSGDDADVSIDEGTTTTAPGEHREVPDPSDFPTPIALGGPTDGKESVGLPVLAEPGSGLLDGQEVAVTGTGFPPGVSVGIVMCAREAGRDHGAQGVAACNIGHFAQVTSDADGVATGTFAVRRLLALAGEEVDCAAEPGRCMVAMGMISDYDTSGGVLVDFDPTVPLPDPPTVTVDPAAGLADGQELAVEVTGLVPGSQASASICTDDQQACADLGVAELVRRDGTTTLELRAWRAFGSTTWSGAPGPVNVDCAEAACELVVWGEPSSGRALPAVPLAFDGGPIERRPPTAVVTSSGPYRPGDTIEVQVDGLDPVQGAELLLCGDGCSGGAGSFEAGDEVVRMGLVVPSAAEGNPCMAGPCTLIVLVHGTGAAGAPPTLLPDPIPVAVVL